jgi:hypothetical protein
MENVGTTGNHGPFSPMDCISSTNKPGRPGPQTARRNSSTRPLRVALNEKTNETRTSVKEYNLSPSLAFFKIINSADINKKKKRPKYEYFNQKK